MISGGPNGPQGNESQARSMDLAEMRTEMDGYVVVGALARIEVDSKGDVLRRIDSLPGFSAFEVEDPLKVGVLIEAASVDEAHSLFSTQLTSVEGVLGAWPVSIEWEEGPEVDQRPADRPTDTAMASPDPAILQPGEHLPESTTDKPEINPEAIR